MQARYFPRKRAVLKRICKLLPVNIGDVLAQVKLMTRTFHWLIHSPRFLRNVCFRSRIRLHIDNTGIITHERVYSTPWAA